MHHLAEQLKQALITLIERYGSPMAFAAWVAVAPARPALAVVMALPAADLVLALICAWRSKTPITSAGLKRSVGKIFVYEVATILAFVVETYLTGNAVPAVKIITGIIGATELKSCLEHLDELNGTPLFSSLISTLAPKQPDPPPSAPHPTTEDKP